MEGVSDKEWDRPEVCAIQTVQPPFSLARRGSVILGILWGHRCPPVCPQISSVIPQDPLPLRSSLLHQDSGVYVCGAAHWNAPWPNGEFKCLSLASNFLAPSHRHIPTEFLSFTSAAMIISDTVLKHAACATATNLTCTSTYSFVRTRSCWLNYVILLVSFTSPHRHCCQTTFWSTPQRRALYHTVYD